MIFKAKMTVSKPITEVSCYYITLYSLVVTEMKHNRFSVRMRGHLVPVDEICFTLACSKKASKLHLITY